MSVNLDAVFSKLGQATEKVEKNMREHMKNMDSSNTEDVMELQRIMQKWTITTSVQSNTIKNIGEGIKSTVANIK